MRKIINFILRPFGFCIGKIISSYEKGEDGSLIYLPLPTGLRAYRFLPLVR